MKASKRSLLTKTNNPMTKQEAIQLMKEGKKVTHIYFSDNEWVTMLPDGRYTFEDNCICSAVGFWHDRQSTQFQTDWSEFKP